MGHGESQFAVLFGERFTNRRQAVGNDMPSDDIEMTGSERSRAVNVVQLGPAGAFALGTCKHTAWIALRASAARC